MIISASRRTDIPAFYGEWFMNRIRAGNCSVLNPFNLAQVQKVSLDLADVDVIVLWTRNPSAFTRNLTELDDRGYKYYFQYTLTGYGPELEPHCLGREQSIAAFQELAGKVGAIRVLWRYDPIIVGGGYTPEYHISNFQKIAEGLRGSTRRVTISLVDNYRKISRRMGDLIGSRNSAEPYDLMPMLRELVSIASENDMELFSCCEPELAEAAGISPGACIDSNYIRDDLLIDIVVDKDRNQRDGCRCVRSKDIGAYNTCLHGCRYCYATTSQKAAIARHDAHDPRSERLI